MKKLFSHQGHIDIKPLLNKANHGDAKAQFALGMDVRKWPMYPQKRLSGRAMVSKIG